MYVRTIGPPDAKIFLVGEAPGEEEDKYGKPFIGEAGRKLDTLLAASCISRNEVLIGNVARERPPGNKIDFFYEDKKKTIPKPKLKKWIEELRSEIIMYRPNIVVALGDTALYHLCDIHGISSFRGYIMESTLVPGQKVLPTYHPQKTNYEWRYGFDVVMDLRKAIANSNTAAISKDQRQLHAGCSLTEFLGYLNFLIEDHREPIAIDIETADPGCHIDILGIAASPVLAYSYTILNGKIPVLSLDSEAKLWRKVGELLSVKETIMQNGVFDMAVLWLHNRVLAKKFTFDTLIAGHILWPERPRSLAYLSAICLNVPAWKYQAEEMPLLYNAADAANTYGVRNYQVRELTKNNYWDIFKFEMAQITPATMLQLQGIYTNLDVRAAIKADVNKRLLQIDAELEQDIGKKVNFRSPKQMQSLLYIDMGLPPQYKRRKSKADARNVTTGAKALVNLERKTSNPVLSKILEYKKLDKLVNDFLDIEVSPDSRVHTSYNITGAT